MRRHAPGAGCIDAASTRTVTGVDVSRYQGRVQFDRFPAHVRYAFIKATQGDTGIDPDYRTNIAAARHAGLAAGTYHYFVSGQKAASQFAHFATHASVEPGDLPPVVDIEVLHGQSNAVLASELKLFLALLEHRYAAVPIVYSSLDFSNRHLKGFSRFPLWLAEYAPRAAPRLPLDWKRWTFWQKSEHARIDGIEGCVDLDSFNGDYAGFQELLIGKAARKP